MSTFISEGTPLSYLNCEVPPLVQPANIGVFICGFEVGVEKADLKKSAKKTDITSSLSFGYLGNVWEEFAPGTLGGSFNFDTKWRASGPVAPNTLRTGAIYPVSLYVRRPGTNGAGDPGSAYTFNWFVESSDLSLDPRQGIIEWKASGSVTGAIVEPT